MGEGADEDEVERGWERLERSVREAGHGGTAVCMPWPVPSARSATPGSAAIPCPHVAHPAHALLWAVARRATASRSSGMETAGTSPTARARATLATRSVPTAPPTHPTPSWLNRRTCAPLQVEAFLGTLALAKAINRTLILPPFIFNFTGFSSLPFGTFFDLDVLKVRRTTTIHAHAPAWPLLSCAPLCIEQEYHRIIPMDVFADELAPAHWPPGSRVGHCISLDPTTKVRDR